MKHNNVVSERIIGRSKPLCCHCYRLQCSCGKVMFLHLSVILFTRRVSGRHAPGQTLPEQTPPGQTPPGQTPPGQIPPG